VSTGSQQVTVWGPVGFEEVCIGSRVAIDINLFVPLVFWMTRQEFSLALKTICDIISV